jgi:hypothetical protein
MSVQRSFSRRYMLQGTAQVSTALVAFGSRSAIAKGLVVGFIYVVPRDDYGYNQAYAEGAGDSRLAHTRRPRPRSPEHRYPWVY